MNKKDEILKMVEELGLPMTRGEALEKLDQMNDGEIDELLRRYKKVDDYEAFARGLSEGIGQDEFDQIEDEYRKDSLDAELKVLDEEEDEQAKEDEREEKYEQDETKKIEDGFRAFEEVAVDLEKMIQEAEDQAAYEEKSLELGAKKS